MRRDRPSSRRSSARSPSRAARTVARSVVFCAACAIAHASPGAALARAEPGPAPVQPADDQHDDLRALVAQVLADAQQRGPHDLTSAPAASPGSTRAATPGQAPHGFEFNPSGSGARLRVRGQIQFRYLVDFRNDNNADGDGSPEDDFESGFQNRRVKFGVEGTAPDPRLSYRITAAFRRADGDSLLEDAAIIWKVADGWTLTAGQFKPPLNREELVGATSQLAVEQSFATVVFLQDWTQGVMLTRTDENVRWSLAFTDGVQAYNSDFTSIRRATPQGLLSRTEAGEADYAASGRLEWRSGSSWDAFRDFTSREGSPTALLAGIAGHVEGADRADPDFSEAGYLYAQWHADLTLKGNGWNALVAAVGGHMSAEPPAGTLPDHRDDFGFTAHFGAYIPGTQWEPYAQYSILLPDADRTGGDVRTFGVLAVGVNYYLHGHAAKFTGDIVWFAGDENALAGPRLGHGYLSDDDPNELLLRFQWQLLF